MQHKQVIFIADSLDNAHKFQQVLKGMDVEVSAGSSMQFKRLLQSRAACDLVIYEIRPHAVDELSQIEVQL